MLETCNLNHSLPIFYYEVQISSLSCPLYELDTRNFFPHFHGFIGRINEAWVFGYQRKIKSHLMNEKKQQNVFLIRDSNKC